MRISAQVLSLAVAFVIASGQSRDAQADFFLHNWENHFQNKSLYSFQLNSAYFSSTSNFDSSGGISSPTGFQNHSRLQGDFIFEYGLSDRLSTFARVTWAYLNQSSSIRSGTNFGFNDQTLGITYRLIKNQSFIAAVDFELQADLPAYSNLAADASSSPYLGDGSVDVTGGGFMTLALTKGATHSLSSVLGAGYTYRTLGFSSAIPWSILLRYSPIQKGFFAGFGAFGILSLRNDPNNGVSAPLRSSVGSGGSFMTGGVNPTLIRLRGQAGYQFNTDMGLTLSATQSVWGQDAPHGIQLEVAVQMRLGNEVKPSDTGVGISKSAYTLNAYIIKSNDRLNLVKIDKGSQDGIEAGQIFEIFSLKEDGAVSESIARGRVSSVKPNEAALDIREYYKEVWIEEGFLAKRLVQ